MAIIVLGGTKGHQSESFDDRSLLLQIYNAYRWKMIPNCTGRYTCRDHNVVSELSPLQMIQRAGTNDNGSYSQLQEYYLSLPGRKDPVIVVTLNTERTIGVITFVKEEEDEEVDNYKEERGFCASSVHGKTVEEQQQQCRRRHYVHTLNTPSGFQRKLEAIGIQEADYSPC